MLPIHKEKFITNIIALRSEDDVLACHDSCWSLTLVSPGSGLRASGAMDCVFCRVIQDDTATWIARGPSTCAFAPLTPIAPGHTLVVPTAHVADIFDAAPDVLAQSMALVRRVADAMRSALGAEGVNILNASGPGSEQSVPHLHFHVIPRWAGDNFSTWPTSRSEHRVAGDPSGRLASALAVE
jgi:histidine triad (HIT) family protein